MDFQDLVPASIAGVLKAKYKVQTQEIAASDALAAMAEFCKQGRTRALLVCAEVEGQPVLALFTQKQPEPSS